MSSELRVNQIESGTGTLNVSGVSFDMGSSTSSFIIPEGTASQRPASPSEGAVRWCRDYNSLEFYDGTAWRVVKKKSKSIVTEGLIVHFDPLVADCYPGSGDTFQNLAGLQGETGQKYGTSSVDTGTGGWIDLGSGQDTTNYFSFDKGIISGEKAWTLDLWMYIHAGNSIDTFFETGASNDMLFYFNGRNSIDFQNTPNVGSKYNTELQKPFHFVATATPSYAGPGQGTIRYYRDGKFISSISTNITVNTPATLARGVIMGQELDSNGGTLDAGQKYRGKYGVIKFYRRPLADYEVKQNFEAHKDRYGVE